MTLGNWHVSSQLLLLLFQYLLDFAQLPAFEGLGFLLFVGIALGYSRSFNRRRLEYYLYAAWLPFADAIVGDLKAKGVLVAPQWPLFYNTSDNGDPNISGNTVAEPNALGVLIDIAIVITYLESRPTTVADLLARLYRSLKDGSMIFPQPYTLARISHLVVPFLIELKRCPPRHYMTPKSWLESTRKIMLAAMDQVEEQAQCLFSMVTYGHQDFVILIAGSGEYWRWRRVNRTFHLSHGNFDLSSYHSRAEETERELDARQLKEDLDDEDADADAVEELVGPFAAAELAESAKRARDERAARYAERVAKRVQLEATSKTMSNPPFAESLLDAVYQEVSAWFHWLRVFLTLVQMTQARFLEPEDGPLPAQKRLTHWTQYLRLGSKASEIHMKYLREELSQVEQEGRRD